MRKCSLLSTALAALLLVGNPPLSSAQQAETSAVATRQNSARIYGGVIAPAKAYRWMVSVGSVGSGHFGGGMLISKRHILTAAHVVQGEFRNDLVVRIDSNDLRSRKAIIRGVKKYTMHPDFFRSRNQDLYNDVAVIELDEPVKGVPVLTLANRVYPEGTQVRTIGWGGTETLNESRLLRQVDLSLVSREFANMVYFGSLTDAHVAASDPNGGKDSCQGDSGGPLVAWDNGRWVLVGITSYGDGCGQIGVPGIYTNVARYLPFIRAKTR